MITKYPVNKIKKGFAVKHIYCLDSNQLDTLSSTLLYEQSNLGQCNFPQEANQTVFAPTQIPLPQHTSTTVASFGRVNPSLPYPTRTGIRDCNKDNETAPAPYSSSVHTGIVVFSAVNR